MLADRKVIVVVTDLGSLVGMCKRGALVAARRSDTLRNGRCSCVMELAPVRPRQPHRHIHTLTQIPVADYCGYRTLQARG